MLMGQVFRSNRGYCVAVNSNDHQPAHVHSYGKGLDASFGLNCPEGPVEYWDHEGSWKLKHLNELGAEIADRLKDCCAEWRRVHG
jgi:hypothetical protein